MNRIDVSRFRRRSTRGHVRRTKRTLPIWLVILFAIIGLAALYGLAQALIPNDEKESKSTYSNRTWLDNDWTTIQPTREQVEGLVKRLEENHINRVYVEAGSWFQSGIYRENEYYDEFLQLMHDTNPDIEVLAWVWVNNALYSNDESQASVFNFLNKALVAGYDGIHIQGFEVFDGNESYVRLLRGLDGITSQRDKILSVTAPPDRRPADPNVPVGGGNLSYSWTPRYKQQIALLADELVIMGHDAGLTSIRDYEAWLAYQVQTYATDVQRVSEDVVIIVAFPTYPTAELHDLSIENIETAINGTKQGVKNAGDAGKLIRGAGIYQYSYTTSRDWVTFKEKWLN